MVNKISFCSAISVGYLLLSIISAYASTDHVNENVALGQTLVCKPGEIHKEETYRYNQDCSETCDVFNRKVCSEMGMTMDSQLCTPTLANERKNQKVWCQSCCAKPPSPPPPTPPPPSPPPPITRAKCEQGGGVYREIPIRKPNCSTCTNWCVDLCKEFGDYKVVGNDCSKDDDSKPDWRQCKCCCNKNSEPEPSPPPSCPTHATWTIPSGAPCEYKLVSSSSSAASSSLLLSN